MGLDAGTVCGNRPIGRCVACGLSVCRVHAAYAEGRVFCLTCSGNTAEPTIPVPMDESPPPLPEDPVDGLVYSEAPPDEDYDKDEFLFTEKEGT